jgi:hypothetical protein
LENMRILMNLFRVSLSLSLSRPLPLWFTIFAHSMCMCLYKILVLLCHYKSWFLHLQDSNKTIQLDTFHVFKVV